jgi:hypothetical protein
MLFTATGVIPRVCDGTGGVWTFDMAHFPSPPNRIRERFISL